MIEGIGVIAQVTGENLEENLEPRESHAARLERMRKAIDERDRQAKLLQRRLARIEEALGLPPLA